MPFIVEAGGRINAAASPDPAVGHGQRHGRAALRGISRALALQQGYTLARIAEENKRLIVLRKVRGSRYVCLLEYEYCTQCT